jgi:hypothetical protein
LSALGHEPGREGQEGHGHEQQDVQAHEHRVDRLETPEEPVMGEPDAADREEARHVREVRRPLVRQGPPEMVELRRVDLDLEHKQRDRDGEDAVAEGLDPAGRPSLAHLARRSWPPAG